MKNRNVGKSRNKSMDNDFKENITFIPNNHFNYELFPKMRLRRLRKTAAIRELFQEIRLSPQDFVIPLFIQEGTNKNLEIESMPGIFRYSPDKILEEIDYISTLGIKAVLLFGIPLKKDLNGKTHLMTKVLFKKPSNPSRKTLETN